MFTHSSCVFMRVNIGYAYVLFVSFRAVPQRRRSRGVCLPGSGVCRLRKNKNRVAFPRFCKLIFDIFCQNVKLSGASVKELITAFAFFR